MAIAAAGMMATTAMQLAIDAFGPIVDNAGGIAEMSELPPDVREKQMYWMLLVTLLLLPVKVLPLQFCALTALALFAAFCWCGRYYGQLIFIKLLCWLILLGGMILSYSHHLAIRAVGEAAMAMVEEAPPVPHHSRALWKVQENRNMINALLFQYRCIYQKMMLPGALPSSLL